MNFKRENRKLLVCTNVQMYNCLFIQNSKCITSRGASVPPRCKNGTFVRKVNEVINTHPNWLARRVLVKHALSGVPKKMGAEMANKYEVTLSNGKVYTVTTNEHHTTKTDFESHLLDVIKGAAGGIIAAVVSHYVFKGRH